MKSNPMQTRSQLPRHPFMQRFGMLGCLGIMALLSLSLLLVLWLVAHRPEYKPLAQCVEHMTQTRAALLRYHQHQKRWPDQLSDLAPIYLEHGHLLRCPLDTAETGSYTYVKPTDASKPDDPIIVCDRHRVMGNRVVIRMRRDKEMPDTQVIGPDPDASSRR